MTPRIDHADTSGTFSLDGETFDDIVCFCSDAEVIERLPERVVTLVDEALGDYVTEQPVDASLGLLDRHERDAAAIAERLGVPHHRLPSSLPGTPFEVVTVVDKPNALAAGEGQFEPGRTLLFFKRVVAPT